MAESLQQALRSLSAVRGQDAGPVTPEMLQELARRAGLPNTDSVADLTRIMGVGADQSVPGEPQYIVFALGDGECALPAESVQGVERVTEITPVPNTVPWVLGVIHLRGAILSVVDLPAFLGLQQRQPLTARATAYAASAINLDGRTVIMLDPHRLLYADKMHRYRADFS
jgi:chemotaxis signal transduction protein